MSSVPDTDTGFDLTQSNNIEELGSGDCMDIDHKVTKDESTEKNVPIEDDQLFLSLKSHIDSQQKLIQLYQTRIRSFERFRKYCQTWTQAGSSGDNADLEQFHNEYNKFERNYRYFKRRIRNLRKQTKSSFSIQYQNPYDTLYELFVKIESVRKDNLNHTKKQEERYLPGDKIYPEISIKVIEPPKQVNGVLERRRRKITTEHSGDGNIVAAKSKRGRPRKQAPKTKNSPVSRRAKSQCLRKSKQIETKTKSSSKTTTLIKTSKRVPKKVTVVKQETSTDTDSTEPPKTKTKKVKKSQISKVFVCDFEGCKYTTTNSWHIKVHNVTHSTDRPFKCDKCDAAFKSKYVWKSHQNVHEGKRFGCTFEGCTVNYATKNGIRDHIKIYHTKEAPLQQCTWEGCKYSTYDKEYFQVHQKVHTGERPYKCPDCDMAFKSVSNLGHHKLIHKNDLRYKCDFEGCAYATYRSDYLKSHRTVHSDERSFKCIWPDCGQTFKTSSSLWCHKMMHENLRRYKCSFDGCDYACNLPGNIQTHEELVHRKTKKKKKKNLSIQNNNNIVNLDLSNPELKTGLSTIEAHHITTDMVNCIGPDGDNHSIQIL